MTADVTALDGYVAVAPERARRYRDAGYWTGANLADQVLAAVAARPPSAPVLLGPDGTVTGWQLRETVRALSAGLLRVGLTRRDRVVVQLPSTPAFVTLALALWRIGAVVVPALPAYRAHELRHVVAASGAVALVVPRRVHRTDHLAMARRVRADQPRLRTLVVADGAGALAGDEIDLAAVADGGDGAEVDVAPPDGADVALLLQSGGSTGAPKCIPRTHDDYLYNLRISTEICAVGPDTTYLAALPVGHNFALGCPGVLGTLLAGGRIAFGTGPAPAQVAAAVARHAVTMTAAVPTLAGQWAEHAAAEPAPWASLRLLQVGGARLFPAAAGRIRSALGCQLQQVYGMAEGLLNFTRLDDPDDVVAQTQGRPASPADETRVVDMAGREVPAGEVGELLTRGPYTIAGYYGAPEANRAGFTPDGFYRTGDLVRWHPSGNIVVTGRTKDVINRAGEKIAAAELEALLLDHPGIAGAAVVGAPSAAYGETVCVFAVARTPLTLHELRAYLRDRELAPYKLPDRLECVDVLPLTPVGKVDKMALRALAEEPS